MSNNTRFKLVFVILGLLFVKDLLIAIPTLRLSNDVRPNKVVTEHRNDTLQFNDFMY